MNKKRQDFEKKIEQLVKAKGHELSGLSIAVTDREKLLYHKGWGRRRISELGDLPMESDSICRVASISKTVTALTAMVLLHKGDLDIHRDLSDYLGFTLRNPYFHDHIITAAQILSHTSSLRDGTAYNIPGNTPISTLLTDKESLPNWSSVNPPGSYFSYCNLGFGVMATVLEKISGKRFDRLVNETVLFPLSKALHKENRRPIASFNIQDFSENDLDHFAALYRKMDDKGIWHSKKNDPWIAQCDDHGELNKILKDKDRYQDYKIGTNGTLFAPQGGLRTSAVTLADLARLFLGKGVINGKKILPSEIFESMMMPQWTFNPTTPVEPDDGEMEWGYVRVSGLGIFHIINAKDQYGSDCFLPHGGPECWGHQGDAYGLKGGMFFDEKEGLGFSYLVTGTAKDPEEKRGKWSNYSLMEETIISLIVECFWPEWLNNMAE